MQHQQLNQFHVGDQGQLIPGLSSSVLLMISEVLYRVLGDCTPGAGVRTVDLWDGRSDCDFAFFTQS